MQSRGADTPREAATNQKMDHREHSNTLERPVHDFFVHLGLIESGTRITKSVILNFLKFRPELQLSMKVSSSSSREYLINTVRNHINR